MIKIYMRLLLFPDKEKKPKWAQRDLNSPTPKSITSI